MKLICLLVAIMLAATVIAPAFAQTAASSAASTPAGVNVPATVTPAPAAGITPAQAQRTIEILQDDAKRAQLIETLQTIAKAAPTVAPAVASAAAPAPATAAAPVAATPAAAATAAAAPVKTPAAAAQAVLVPAAGLGRQLLGQIWDWGDRMAVQMAEAAQAVTNFPLLWRSIEHSVENPTTRAWALATAWKLAFVFGCGLAVEWVLAWMLRRPNRELERHAPGLGELGREARSDRNAADAEPQLPLDDPPVPEAAIEPGTVTGVARPPLHGHSRLSGAWQVVRRLPFAFAGLILRAIPIAAFAMVANVLTATDVIEADARTRLAIMVVVNAYVMLKAVMAVTRMLVCEAQPQLAIIRMKAENAAYIEVWVTRIAVLVLFGVVVGETAELLGLTWGARMTLLKLIALIVHICFVIIILQCRRGVAEAIRAPVGAHGGLATLRNRFAAVWHYLAAALVIALWIIWAVQVRNGLSSLMRFTVLTVVVLGVGRLIAVVAIGSLDRLFHLHPAVATRYPGLEARANRYYPLLRGAVSLAVWLATLLALLEIWGLDALSWFSHGRTGDKLVSAAVTIAVAIIIAIAIWESANAAMDSHVARLGREQQTVRIARVKTLLPILRNVLLIAIVVILGLTILSQIGVNIAPLLAGAGILGVALGFGSQKLVQDLITGLFLLLENAMQVGDWVTAGGLSGSVETLSIRTMRLRAGDGSLHIIPFSAVTTVTNTNRGVGNAAVSVNVAIKEDPDRVGDVLKTIAAEMRKDPQFADGMQSDLQLWGVDKVDASVMTIVGQIVCTDSGRWGVQREFNRRMKIRFQELGIEIANPTQTVVMARPDRQAEAPTRSPGLSVVGGGASTAATTTTDSPPPAALGHGE